MEATAKHDYEATASDELSFRKGERLKILQTTGNWYKAELHGVEGFVPKNFINFHLPSWYQENFSRSDAKEKLMLKSEGAFVIRGSQNSAAGQFSISVRRAADVQHFKVLQNSRGQYYLWSEKFTSLNQLVEHYKKNYISVDSPVFLREIQQQQGGGLDIQTSLHAPPLTPSCPPSPAPRQQGGGLDIQTSLPAHPLTPSCPPLPAPRQHKGSSTMQVRALYSFHAEETDELDFKVGDVIQVLECSDETWWRGQLRDKTGLFPSNYTKPL